MCLGRADYPKEKQIIRGTNEIQDRQVRFYKELFTSENVNNDYSFFLNNPIKQLSELSKNGLESDITHTEICKAMKLMPNNKSPGEDGITIEFYKTYWNIIGHDMHEVFIKGLNNRELSYTQYLAAISLLYKKGSREDIRNWRPISLLNVDYKILSKVLSERLKKVLPEIIHTDQKGAVKGRYIGENIRLIASLLSSFDLTLLNPIFSFERSIAPAFDVIIKTTFLKSIVLPLLSVSFP